MNILKDKHIRTEVFEKGTDYVTVLDLLGHLQVSLCTHVLCSIRKRIFPWKKNHWKHFMEILHPTLTETLKYDR